MTRHRERSYNPPRYSTDTFTKEPHFIPQFMSKELAPAPGEQMPGMPPYPYGSGTQQRPLQPPM